MKNIQIERYVRIIIEKRGLAPDGKTIYRDREVLFEYDLPRDLYERKKWVINWRSARFQCLYPRSNITLAHCFYDKKTGQDLFDRGAPINKLIAAKRNVTKMENILEKAREDAKGTLFDHTHHAGYQKFVERLEGYRRRVQELTEEIYGTT